MNFYDWINSFKSKKELRTIDSVLGCFTQALEDLKEVVKREREDSILADQQADAYREIAVGHMSEANRGQKICNNISKNILGD